MTIIRTIKGLFFDVFGTCVDWRGGVTRGLCEASRRTLNETTNSMPSSVRARAADMDMERWGSFAQDWRGSYFDFTRSFVSGEIREWKSIDRHHLESLQELLERHGLTGLWSTAQVEELSLLWHQLDPWPDVVEGITRLNAKFHTCTLSNGNLELLNDLKSYSGIPFKHVVGADQFQSYKPAPIMYLGTAEAVGLKPNECALVAAHLGDLKAAKAQGFAVVYVQRPQEEPMSTVEVEEAKRDTWVDIWISQGESGFLTAAERLLA